MNISELLMTKSDRMRAGLVELRMADIGIEFGLEL